MSRRSRIIIPLLIAVAVLAVWFLKNAAREPVALDDSDFALHVTGRFDLEQLKSHGLPMIIDFGSDSCDACLRMAPALAELNEQLRGKAIIKFVDVWKYPELADGYPLSVIPTQIFFDWEGKPYLPADPEGSGMLLYSLQGSNEHVFTAHEGGLTKEQLLEVLVEMGLDQ